MVIRPAARRPVGPVLPVLLALLAGCAGPAATVTPAGTLPGGSAPSPGPTGAAGATTTAPPAGVSSSLPSAVPVATPAAAPTPAGTARPAMGRDGIPAFRHVYLIVMENHEYDAIIGHPDAPYLNSLATRHGLLTDYTAVAHPSQPNYLALFSGSTQGVTDDGIHDIDAPTLADRLDAAGRSWAVFAQNVPSGCFTGDVSSGGPDGPGTYARKHNPAISFTSISGNPARCARIRDFTAFDPAAADFELVVPNLCNDMHDCTVAVGDAFLRDFVPRIVDAPSFVDSVLFITWDEGSSSDGGGGRVPAIVVSPLLAGPGVRSDRPHDHYGLLRTIEDAWALECLGDSCSAPNLGELFAR